MVKEVMPVIMSSTFNTPSAPSFAALQLPFWRQLRWSLLSTFILLAVAPLVIVQYITVQQTADQAQKQVFNQLESVSQLKTNELQQWLANGHAQLLNMLRPDTEKVIADLIAAPTNDAQASANQILTHTASIIANISGQTTTRLFNNLFVYGTDGKVLAASNLDNKDDLGKVVTRQPYYANSLRESYTQAPFYDVATGQLIIILSEPIQFQGRVVGVVAAEANISTLNSILTERGGLGQSGETYLVSSENNYFLTPSRYEGISQTQAYHTTGIDNALKGASGAAGYLNYRGNAVLGYYRWIPELQAGLLAEQDTTEALAAVQSVISSAVLVAASSLLVALAVGFFLAGQISNPVRLLAEAATKITGGNLSVRAIIRQRNEIGVLGIAFNHMTDQLARNIQQLDHQLQEINSTNQELQIASAQAREAARMKSEFMATMSHELRTPLNAMLGFSSILLEGMGGDIDEEAQHMIGRIQANSDRLLNLINGVLDIAKIEAGRLEIIEQPVDIRLLASGWKGQMEVLAQQKNLAFDLEIDPDLPITIKTDSERLSQIAVNLLANAFKFTEKGGVRISLKAVSNQLQIEVTDTGIGIPSHALNFIFEEFRQLDGSSRRAYGGSGLGLAIVRNLCRMMNGSVHVRSEQGIGSTFTVTLPLISIAQLVAV
jgi:signal transduction histidine kinase